MTDVQITVILNGPYKVEGPIRVEDDEGRSVGTREGKAVFLCRCGQSSTKPFCDGTHKEVGFEGAESQLLDEAYDA